jgi:hypothetical protein
VRIPKLVKEVAAGSLTGIVVGIIVGGLGSRLVMRLSAMAADSFVQGVTTSNGNRVGDITLSGTIALVVFGGIFAGMLGGLLYASVRPWLVRFGRWRGLIFGLGLLGLAGSLILDQANSDFIILRPALLNVAMFAGLFVIFGLAVVPVFDRVLRFLEGGSFIASLLTMIGTVVAAVFLGTGLVAALTSLGSSTTPIDLIQLLSLGVVIAGFAARLLRPNTMAPPWAPASYALLAAAVIAGAFLTYTNVARILS